MLSALNRRSIVGWSAVVLAILIGAPIAAYHRRPHELPVYLKAAERFVSGEQIYVYEHKAFTYPPFFVLPFTLLVPFPDEARRSLWWMANLGMLATILGLVGSMLRATLPDDRRKRRIAAIILVLLSARLLLTPIEHESHDLIVLLMIAISAHFLRRSRPGWAGALAGIAASCKATPLLLFPYFLWQRRWLAATTMLLAGAVTTILPDILSPNPEGKLWLQTWNERFVSPVRPGESPQVSGAWASWAMKNQSMAGTAHRWFNSITEEDGRIDVCLIDLSGRTVRILVLVAQAVVILLIAWATRPGIESADDQANVTRRVLAHYGLLVCAMLLLSPVSTSQHFCALVIPLAALSGEAVRRPCHPGVLAALLGVLIFGPLGAQDLVGRSLSDLFQALGARTLCATVCLIATAWLATTPRGASGDCRDPRCAGRGPFQPGVLRSAS